MITVVSYGTGHGPLEVEADVIFPLARRFRDPHVSPEMREMTGMDVDVHANVMGQPGAVALLDMAFNATLGLYAAHQQAPIIVAFSCVGGRHRSVVFANGLNAMLNRWYPNRITLAHRDLGRPVIVR